MTRQLWRLLIVVVVFVVVSSGEPALAATDWLFTGEVTSERGSTAVNLKGELRAPSAPPELSYSTESQYAQAGYYLVTAICLIKRGTPDPDPSVVFNREDQRCRSWYAPRLSNGHYGQAPGAVQFIDLASQATPLSAGDGPGIYDVKIFTADRDAPIALPGAAPITIVAVAARVPTLVASATQVVVGQTVTFSAVNRVTWSDGHSNDEAPAGQQLMFQIRDVGIATWTNGPRKSPATARIMGPVEARVLIDGQPSVPLLITAIRPTRQQRFSSMMSSASRVYAGSPLALTFTLDTLYTDDQWRPTPRQTVKVQYSPNGKSAWSPIANAWIVRGAGRKTVIPERTGFWRVVSGSAVTDPVRVTVVKR